MPSLYRFDCIIFKSRWLHKSQISGNQRTKQNNQQTFKTHRNDRLMVTGYLIPRKAKDRNHETWNIIVKGIQFVKTRKLSTCQDILTDPRYLPCLHSFCLNCLINWHRASGGEVNLRCPKCQGRSRVPASGDLKDLPTSFFLSGFIDALAIKESDKTHVTCGNCDKKSSKTSYCFECCKFYCDECLIGHNIIRSYKDHRVLAVKDFQEKDYEVVVKRPVFCSRKGHEKEELKFFCKTCPENSVCQTCVILDHAGHKVPYIQEFKYYKFFYYTKWDDLCAPTRGNPGSLCGRLDIRHSLEFGYPPRVSAGSFPETAAGNRAHVCAT